MADRKTGGDSARRGRLNQPMPDSQHNVTLPRADYTYPDAEIGYTYASSVPDFPPLVEPPVGAPNVVVVLLDDVGFGQPSPFGGLVEMPTADRLAASGLRYNQFHTAALCSPTRAALLTGRNHHTVHTGNVAEVATGFPGYDGIIPRSCATIAELLHEYGYATGWWGKNHNVPDNCLSEAGPFDNWPTNRGMDYFFGFFGGETDQFRPALYRGTQPLEASGTAEDGYHLTRDLADDCIQWMKRQKAIAPNRPLFCHFAPGGVHAPHQPPLDWRGRNAGRFDMGWDEYRSTVHRRQLEMGIIPPETSLTPRPEQIPAWDSYTVAERRLFSRYAENFADFLSHTDYEVGRVIDALEDLDVLDNTLIFYILGDNGASAEGTLTGVINEFTTVNGIEPEVGRALEKIDEIGLPGTSPHYPVGWAWAGDTPFQWVKQIASHFGCTRNGAIVSWPDRIKDAGAVRAQFHHVIDVVPTILDVIGIPEPSSVGGVSQQQIEGTSMAYTFSEENAAAPSRRRLQYFEMLGHRAIYHNGWIASCRHSTLPWGSYESTDISEDRWELYDLESDFSQAIDLSTEQPERLEELQRMFMIEAAKHNVFPLDDRFVERLDVSLRPSYFQSRKSITLPGEFTRLPEGSAPRLHNVSHTISVRMDVPEGGAEGVLICLGGEMGGWALFIDGDRLIYHYNWLDIERYEVKSSLLVPSGGVEVCCVFKNLSEVLGGPAEVRLAINGKEAGMGSIMRQVKGRFSLESLDVGLDALSPVSPGYADRSPFRFTGTIESVHIDLGRAVALPSSDDLAMRLRMD